MRFFDQFFSGFARKLGMAVAALLLAGLLTLLGMGEARAALPVTGTTNYPASGCSRSTSNNTAAQCADRGAAYSGCQASMNAANLAISGGGFTCNYAPTATEAKYSCYSPYNGDCGFGTVSGTDRAAHFSAPLNCPAPKVWNAATNTCAIQCNPNGAPLAGGYMKYTGDEPGYQTCSGGCEYNPASMTYQTGTIDGIKFVSLKDWIPSGASCTVGPNDNYTPPADSDKDGTSDGFDQGDNNPGIGSGEGEDQSGGSGEGEGSGNGNKSGGGQNCQSPPHSTGDAIAAQIAYQTWATRCAIENAKNEDGSLKTDGGGSEGPGGGSGGEEGGEEQGKGSASANCDSPPSCSIGDGVVCAVLHQSYYNMCKLVGDVKESLSPEGEKDASDSFFGGLFGEEDVDGLFVDAEDLLDEVDTSGFGSRGSCPIEFSFGVFGRSYEVTCEHLGPVLDALAGLVLLVMSFHTGVILLGGRVR